MINPDRSRVELYDIPADPMELNNAAEQYPDVVDSLGKKLIDWQKTLPEDPVTRAPDPMITRGPNRMHGPGRN